MVNMHVQMSPYDLSVIGGYTTLCNSKVISASSEPYSVANDGKGHLYVAGEYIILSIDVFDQDVKLLVARGGANGQFKSPIGKFIQGIKCDILC